MWLVGPNGPGWSLVRVLQDTCEPHKCSPMHSFFHWQIPTIIVEYGIHIHIVNMVIIESESLSQVDKVSSYCESAVRRHVEKWLLTNDAKT